MFGDPARVRLADLDRVRGVFAISHDHHNNYNDDDNDFDHDHFNGDQHDRFYQLDRHDNYDDNDHDDDNYCNNYYYRVILA